MKHFNLKSYCISCILVLSFTGIYAQKTFEGKIVYKMTSQADAESAELTAFFGKDKIKALVKTSGGTDNGMEDLVIDFKNGIIHYIKSRSKTYRTDSITGKLQKMPALKAIPEKNRTVLGYTCTIYKTSDTDKNGFMKDMDFSFFYADSLYYTVKKEYTNLEMIPIFTNGKNIGLGVEMKQMIAGHFNNISFTPQSIIAQEVPDSVFSLDGLTFKEPGDEAYPMADSTMMAADSAMMVVDSAAKAAVEAVKKAANESDKTKKNKTKKSPSKNTHTQPTKSAANKPKE